MKSTNKLIALVLSLFVSLLNLAACSSKKTDTLSKTSNYIRVNDNELSKEYIGYFFYVAQRNMIQEAGMVLGEGGNSTQSDVDEFWKTTEINGKKAVDAARDVAVDQAVMLTVQYLKAVEEEITLSPEDKKAIDDQIQSAIESSGGEEAFNQKLSEMGCSKDAYKQILIENMVVNKLYFKYDSEGKLDISDQELSSYLQNNPDVSPDKVLEFAKKDKFNAMSQEWEKTCDIVINDENMKDFDVK